MLTTDIVRPVRIVKVIQESSNIRTVVFKDEACLNARPGQFAMVWLPGVSEFPMSISLPFPSGRSSITIKAMGEGTKSLYEIAVGETIGVRGPYGNSFEITKKMKRVLLVGGGTGMAPIILLARQISQLEGIDAKLVIGARSQAELPFLKSAKKFLDSENVFPTTDDGSFGFKGIAHELVRDMVRNFRFDAIFSCGPELMMLSLYEIAKLRKIPVQFSLERVMKCGIGICGSCTIADVVLCKDGPVLNDSSLKRVSKEFGLFERDKTGTLISKRSRIKKVA
ncbi:MAG: dihydroorotate dehydrogenase electron transfer subunit [Nitrososphaerales archaeon]